jgi:hypothetical protein
MKFIPERRSSVATGTTDEPAGMNFPSDRFFPLSVCSGIKGGVKIGRLFLPGLFSRTEFLSAPGVCSRFCGFVLPYRVFGSCNNIIKPNETAERNLEYFYGFGSGLALFKSSSPVSSAYQSVSPYY